MTPRPAGLLGILALVIASTSGRLAAAEPVQAGPAPGAKERFTLQELLPLAWQKRPAIRFNVLTEMTAEGRKRTPPTAERPVYYVTSSPKFTQMGWSVAAGEKSPPVSELEAAIKNALAASHFLPTSSPDQRPDILIMLGYGSHGTDPASTLFEDSGFPPTAAGELVPLVLADPALFRDVIDRAALVGGEKFARELKRALDEEVKNMKTNQSLARNESPIQLPVSPEFGSPFQIFSRSGKNSALTAHLSELAFRTCYFVIASAYDFAGVETRQRIPLWRTKMTVEAQGASMAEVFAPLVASAGPYLGRDMDEAAIVTKRIDREGKVQLGPLRVMDEPAPANMPAEPKRP